MLFPFDWYVVLVLLFALRLNLKNRRIEKGLRHDIHGMMNMMHRAIPFINPRPDYNDRAEGSFSEMIRAALIRDELKEVVE